MNIFKVGGSIFREKELLSCLKLLLSFNVKGAVVTGGGNFREQVRICQKKYKFDDLAAHTMSILSMIQNSYIVESLFKNKTKFFRHPGELRDVLKHNNFGIWQPYDKLTYFETNDSNWNVTSDSLALELALEVNAASLIIIKACKVPGVSSFGPIKPILYREVKRLANLGIIDSHFPRSFKLFKARTYILPLSNLKNLNKNKLLI